MPACRELRRQRVLAHAKMICALLFCSSVGSFIRHPLCLFGACERAPPAAADRPTACGGRPERGNESTGAAHRYEMPDWVRHPWDDRQPRHMDAQVGRYQKGLMKPPNKSSRRTVIIIDVDEEFIKNEDHREMAGLGGDVRASER